MLYNGINDIPKQLKSPISSHFRTLWRISLQQRRLYIGKHDIQRSYATLSSIPDSRISQIHNMPFLISVQTHHKFVFHDIACKLCAFRVDRCITVEYKDILRILLDDKLKGSLVAMHTARTPAMVSIHPR